MRSVWPNGTVWGFQQNGRQTGRHAVSATIPAEDIGAWVHLVGTYDGVNWNLYKNGELLASRADTVGCVPLTTNWYIGSSNGNARFFDGEIRDVAIWNTTLTASQAAAVYAETAPSADYPTVVTSYTYDALNRLTSLTDPVGNTTSYTYDYRGLVLTETNEKNATRHYTYDTLGRLISKTDRNDRVTTYAYDSVGRLTAEHWGDTSDYFMYTYDLVGNLLYATDGDHSYSYKYDALYRPIYTSFNFDSQSAVFSYTYDSAGRQTSSSLTLNGYADRVNEVTYDFLGNATSIRQHGNITDEIFAEFDYNANSLLTSVRRFEKDDDNTLNEIAESLYEYNANNAVTSITHNNANGTQVVKHSYTYDETNNIVEYLNSIDGNTEYNYDFLGQLISADHASQTDESYAYDSNGNRVVANGDAYTTGTNNELTSDGTYTYTYDAEGNRISKTNTANTERELYTWDHRNRLTSVTKQTYDTETQTWETVQIVEYTYDYNNIWIRKVVGDSKTIFIPEAYQTSVQIDNGTVAHHYLWTPNSQDKLIADTTPTEVLWSLTDHLGTIRDVLGATTTHLIYDAFGNLISGTNPLLFGYTGKAFDSDTHLQNNINRWYDSTIGRWLSTDPIGFEGNDTNLYRYVKNRILKFLDSWGLQDLLQWATNLPEIPEWLKELKIDFIINEVDCKCNSQGVSIQDENTSFQLGKNRAHFRYFENGRAIEIDYNAEQIMMQLIEEHLRIQLATDEGNVSASIQRNFAEGVTGARYEDGRLSGFYQQDAWMIEAMHDTTSNTTEVASKGPWGRLDMTYDPGYGTNVHIKGPYFEAGYSPNGMFGSGWFSRPGLQFGGGVDANGNLFTEAKVWKRFPNYIIEVGGSARKDCYQVDLLWQTKDPYDKTNKKRIELKNLIRKTQENFEISTGLNIFF